KLAQKLKIKKLLDVIAGDNPVVQVSDAIKKVTDLKSAVDPTMIDLDVLTFDRKALRDYLGLLAKENHPVKVLLIRGDSKSGKTYSRHLCEAMARQQNIEPVFLFKSVVVTLDDVLDALFTAAGDKNAKPKKETNGNMSETDTTSIAWYMKICRALVETASDKKKCIWLIMDDLGIKETTDTQGVKKEVSIMDPLIRDFFNQFVNHMAEPQFRKHFRMTLINYPPGKLPTGWDRTHLKEDMVKESDITVDHIKEVITNWYQIKGKQVVDLEQQVAAIINRVDNVVADEDTPPRLERLKDEVSKVISTV
ncbi:MAG TPA: hypothetical protein VHM26_18380, partial [Chitinophagaceae bacterium]|nr:hypothetical protein [Chitinophagaceae bacterium]